MHGRLSVSYRLHRPEASPRQVGVGRGDLHQPNSGDQPGVPFVLFGLGTLPSSVRSSPPRRGTSALVGKTVDPQGSRDRQSKAASAQRWALWVGRVKSFASLRVDRSPTIRVPPSSAPSSPGTIRLRASPRPALAACGEGLGSTRKSPNRCSARRWSIGTAARWDGRGVLEEGSDVAARAVRQPRPRQLSRPNAAASGGVSRRTPRRGRGVPGPR